MGKFIGEPKETGRCAFCKNPIHYGYLSVRNMKNHKCESKQCKWFVKIPDHPYWQQKEKKKSDKAFRKRLRQIEDTIKYGSNDQIGCLIEKIILKEW